MRRLPEKTTEEIVREYVDCINQYPLLSSKEEALLVERWEEGHPSALNLLICSNLRHVIYPGRRVAWSYYESRDYWPALRELIGAGNKGLVLAVGRFRPDSGVLFRTAAQYSIKKEILAQALFDRGSVTRPYGVKFSRDVSLDALRGPDDREIDLTLGKLPGRRFLCPQANDNGDAGSPFADMMSEGFVALMEQDGLTPDGRRAKLVEDELLRGPLDQLQALLHAKASQILDARERRIYLARYLTPDQPIKLKVLAKELGIKIPRVHQIGVAADKKVREAIDWEPIITPRFPPTWSLIEEWCDERPKKQPPRVEVRFCWADAKRGRRIYKRTLVEEASVIEWEGASDYNVNRVRAAIEAGTNSDEIGKSLGIPTTICEDPSYNPALHLASLAAMRLAAARQDEQQAARVQAFKESKRAEMLERCARYKEQRVTLTTKGYEKIRELEQHREAEDAATSPKGSHHAPAARKSSAA